MAGTNGGGRAWRNAGFACIEYGFIVFSALLLFDYATGSVVMERLLGLRVPLHLAVALLPAGLVYVSRLGRDHRELLPPKSEIAIATVAVFGFNMVMVTVGLILVALTDRYTGIEKWLPDIQDRPAYEMARLQQAISALELSREVHDAAVELLEEVRDKGLMRAYPFPQMLGGVIYIAAKDAKDPRTLDEVADAVGASKKAVGRAYRYIGRNTDARVLPPAPEDHLKRFADRLELDDAVREHAMDLIERAREEEILSGKSPKGIAAAALYVAARLAGDDRTLTDVAETVGVTTITVRARAREFIDELGLDTEMPGDD